MKFISFLLYETIKTKNKVFVEIVANEIKESDIVIESHKQ